MSSQRTLTLSAAVLVAAVALAAFWLSIPTQVWTGDTAEAQTVPYILGIAHPTGFPAYTLLGWLFTHAFAIGTVAWRANVFTATCVACSACGVFWLACELEAPVAAACAAALLFAFGTIVYSEALLANTHALSGMLIVFALAASVAFARRENMRIFVAACGCAGLGLATHPETIWVLPALFLAAAWRQSAFTLKRSLLVCAALLVPLALYLYLPLRSEMIAVGSLDPAAGAPLFGAGEIDWDTSHPRTVSGFLDEVLGRREHASSSVAATLSLQHFPRAIAFWSQQAWWDYGPLPLIVSALGIFAVARRDLRALTIIGAGTLGGILFASTYRSDADIGWFFVPSLAVTAALAAAATRIAVPRVDSRVVPFAVTTGLAVFAVLAWRNDATLAPNVARDGGQAIVDQVTRDVPDGAIVIAAWRDAAALGYGSAVEHALGTRTVITAWPSEFVARYPQWARSRRVVIYTGGLGLLSLTGVPRQWRHELPSTSLFHHVVEVVP